jgi:hypothetical protein
MNNSTIVFLINDHARAFKAIYEEGGTKTVFKTMDQTIAVDDMVVVQSTTRHEMTVVKVTDVDVEVNFDSSSEVKWAVQKIELTPFETILAQEQEAIEAVQAAERRRKKAELRETMFKDHEESIAALSIADRSDEAITE